VFDCPVLAGRVHRLKDQQDRVGVLGVEHVLQDRQPLDALGEQPLRVLLP
jgi:hypothetical protein